jgi:hypothetical protein
MDYYKRNQSQCAIIEKYDQYFSVATLTLEDWRTNIQAYVITKQHSRDLKGYTLQSRGDRHVPFTAGKVYVSVIIALRFVIYFTGESKLTKQQIHYSGDKHPTVYIRPATCFGPLSTFINESVTLLVNGPERGEIIFLP